MVIRRRAVSPKAGLHALTQTQSTLAHDLDIRAVAALNEAREIPPGAIKTASASAESSGQAASLVHGEVISVRLRHAQGPETLE